MPPLAEQECVQRLERQGWNRRLVHSLQSRPCRLRDDPDAVGSVSQRDTWLQATDDNLFGPSPAEATGGRTYRYPDLRTAREIEPGRSHADDLKTNGVDHERDVAQIRGTVQPALPHPMCHNRNGRHGGLVPKPRSPPQRDTERREELRRHLRDGN